MYCERHHDTRRQQQGHDVEVERRFFEWNEVNFSAFWNGD